MGAIGRFARCLARLEQHGARSRTVFIHPTSYDWGLKTKNNYTFDDDECFEDDGTRKDLERLDEVYALTRVLLSSPNLLTVVLHAAADYAEEIADSAKGPSENSLDSHAQYVSGVHWFKDAAVKLREIGTDYLDVKAAIGLL